MRGVKAPLSIARPAHTHAMGICHSKSVLPLVYAPPAADSPTLPPASLPHPPLSSPSTANAGAPLDGTSADAGSEGRVKTVALRRLAGQSWGMTLMDTFEGEKGAFVNLVAPDTPASAAGFAALHRGCHIIHASGHHAQELATYTEVMAILRDRETVQIQLLVVPHVPYGGYAEHFYPPQQHHGTGRAGGPGGPGGIGYAGGAAMGHSSYSPGQGEGGALVPGALVRPIQVQGVQSSSRSSSQQTSQSSSEKVFIHRISKTQSTPSKPDVPANQRMQRMMTSGDFIRKSPSCQLPGNYEQSARQLLKLSGNDGGDKKRSGSASTLIAGEFAKQTHSPSREYILRFIPEYVKEALVGGGAGSSNASGSMEPIVFSEERPAAVMLADVSGFTKLTEVLAKQGAHGSETLTRVLNAFYSCLIEVMQRCGGDVIKFAGDAVLASFVEPELRNVAGAGAGGGAEVGGGPAAEQLPPMPPYDTGTNVRVFFPNCASAQTGQGEWYHGVVWGPPEEDGRQRVHFDDGDVDLFDFRSTGHEFVPPRRLTPPEPPKPRITPEMARERSTLRAAHCSLEILELVEKYPAVGAGDLKVKLGMHIGVGCGTAIRMLIGGLLNRWEAVCAGTALLQLGDAVGDAKVGEVCLSAQATTMIRKSCDTESVEGTIKSRRLVRMTKELPDWAAPGGSGRGGDDQVASPDGSNSAPVSFRIPTEALADVSVALGRFVPGAVLSTLGMLSSKFGPRKSKVMLASLGLASPRKSKVSPGSSVGSPGSPASPSSPRSPSSPASSVGSDNTSTSGRKRASSGWGKVRSAVKSGASAALNILSGVNEIRQHVTIIFVALPGMDVSTQACVPKLHAALTKMQKTCFDFEGSFNKLLVDDKGVLMVWAYGLPPFAHSDDSTRAVKFALKSQEILAEDDMPIAVGIATGTAFCGIIGNSARCEYTLMGDSVNLAARLMQKALPAGLVCDKHTHDSAQRERSPEVVFLPLGATRVKGKSASLETYTAQLASVGNMSREMYLDLDGMSDFVGRENDVERVFSTLRAYLNDHDRYRDPDYETSSPPSPRNKGVLIMQGVEGVGKTYMLSKMYAMVAEEDEEEEYDDEEGDEEDEEKEGIKETTKATGPILPACFASAPAQLSRHPLGPLMCIGCGGSTESREPYFAWRSIFIDLLGLAEELGGGRVRGRTQSNAIGMSGMSSCGAENVGSGDSDEDRANDVEGTLTAVDAFVETMDVPPGGESNHWTERVPLLSPVLGTKIIDTITTGTMDERDRGEGTLNIMLAIVRHVAERRPVFIMLDNAQWIDLLSWQLIEQVSGQVHTRRSGAGRGPPCPFMVICTRPLSQPQGGSRARALANSTDSGVRTMLERLQRQPNVDFMVLEPMSDQEITECVLKSLNITSMPRKLLNIVIRKSQGLPYVPCGEVHATLWTTS